MTTDPGMFTQRFARVKGEAEVALLKLSKTTHPSLRIYHVRPAVVDPQKDIETHPFLPKHGGLQGRLEGIMWPAARVLAPSMHSPTEELGKAFIKLVTGDGEPMVGKGVTGEGRTLGNIALKRVAAS